MNINLIQPRITPKTAIRRDAEKILRLLNSEFPMIASTKICEFDSVKKTPRFIQYAREIQERIFKLVRDPAWKEQIKGGDDAFYAAFVENIKKQRVGNCSESSKLFKLLGHLNGIPSRKAQLTLFTKDGGYDKNIDHAIHIVCLDGNNPDFEKLSKLKDTLIIDPWLGIAEYAPKYEQLISSAYNRFFGIEDYHSVCLSTAGFGEPKISENLVKYFAHKYPQFFIKAGEPLIKHKK